MIPAPDHIILDVIRAAMRRHPGPSPRPATDPWKVSRESECVEFTDPKTGLHYEIVVRQIEERSNG